MAAPGSLSQPTSSGEDDFGLTMQWGRASNYLHKPPPFLLIKGEKTHHQRLPLLGSIETGLELVLLLLDGAFLLTQS